jgi:Tfp pilus assembly protein PilV
MQTLLRLLPDVVIVIGALAAVWWYRRRSAQAEARVDKLLEQWRVLLDESRARRQEAGEAIACAREAYDAAQAVLTMAASDRRAIRRADALLAWHGEPPVGP